MKLWKIWAKAMGSKISDDDRESDAAANLYETAEAEEDFHKIENISPKRKTFNVRTKIKVNIEAESLQEAEDMFFNVSISFQNKQGKELQWELMDSQIEEA